jgi:hypothetical protein
VLARERRTEPTYTNVAKYVEDYGVDPHVAGILTKAKKITDAANETLEGRRQLAIELLNAGDHVSSTIIRVSLAASVDPGHIPATSLKSESSDLVARLLRKRLLPDDLSTFLAGILTNWIAHEATIVASKNYASFVAPEILPAATMSLFFRSTRISSETKLAVLTTSQPI